MLFRVNKVKCLHCNDVLVSTDDIPEDTCSCGVNTIHGGSKFLARTGKKGVDYKELSEVNLTEELEGSEDTSEIEDLRRWQNNNQKGK
jgi:hypothetical protein